MYVKKSTRHFLVELLRRREQINPPIAGQEVLSLKAVFHRGNAERKDPRRGATDHEHMIIVPEPEQSFRGAGDLVVAAVKTISP